MGWLFSQIKFRHRVERERERGSVRARSKGKSGQAASSSNDNIFFATINESKCESSHFIFN